MIRDDLTDSLRRALAAVGLDGGGPIGLEQPANREHGDWSSNVAMTRAKTARRPPRDLAADLVAHLTAEPPRHVTSVEVAGPGFVNFRLDPGWLHDVLRDVARAGVDGYARSSIGAGRKVMVEFVSANPTGPLHAGHARGAVYGDAVARLLEAVGHEVWREFYINDRGAQMAKFGDSIAARAKGAEPPEDGYHGEYITEWARGLPEGEDPTEYGYRRALEDQREVLEQLDIAFDRWFSERSLESSGAIDATLADLRDRGVVDDHDGAVWLRSTDFGDDKDRVLVRSNGEATYLLPDIAYHRDKFARGYDVLLDVWGADHHGYVQRMSAAIEALGHDPASFEVAITQLVRLTRDGVEVKISKRTGELIELRELLEQVGPDATRLTYLLQSVDSPQTVDLAAMVAQSMDNPVFYVQMAHARLCSIGRVAAERGVTAVDPATVDLSPLTHQRELDVLRSLGDLPDVIEIAARDRAPHKVTAWLRELAGGIHGWYHDCPVLRDDVPDGVRDARLALADAALIGLRVGLGVLGVRAPESM